MGRTVENRSEWSPCDDGVVTLLAQSPEAVIIFDGRNRIIFVNRRAEDLCDRPGSQMVGQDIGTVLPREVLRSGAWNRSDPVTVRIEGGRAGQRRCVLSCATLAREAGDEFVATLRDVTSETKELARLRLLSIAAEKTGTSVLVSDVQGRIIFANAGFERLTGYAPEWAMGRTPGSFLQGELSDQATIRRIREGLRDGVPVHEEIVNYNRDGVPYLIELLIFPVRDGSGQISNFVSVEANITATRDTQRHQTAMLHAISGATAIAQWSETGAALECNAFLSTQGPGRPHLSDILTDKERTAVKAGGVVRCEVPWPREGRNPIWLEAVFSSTRDISGRVDRFIMCGSDATARRSSVRAGSNAMRGMMEGINGLTKTIRRVSRMTNILSVNAAIEASLAGEAGRGFGVIGMEIRALSGEVHDTLERIDALIHEGRDTVSRLQSTVAPERR